MDNIKTTYASTSQADLDADAAEQGFKTTQEKIAFYRIPRDSPPIVDQYGDYKSDSQLFFTDKLKESKKWSLWLTVVFVIISWNDFITGIELDPIVEYHFQHTLRCRINDLENTNWTFKQIKTISHYSNGTGVCYYYNHDYQHLSVFTFEEAFNITESFNKTNILKCAKYVLCIKDSRYNYMDKFNVFCDPPYIHLFYFVDIGHIFGYVVYGIIADIYGRKKALLATLPLSVTCSILVAIAPERWTAFVSLFFMSTGFKGASNVGVTLFLELVNYKIRIFAITLVRIGFSLGKYIKALFYFQSQEYVVRYLQWIIVSTLLLPISTFWLLPESPHWLLCKKDWKNMVKVLNDLNYPNIIELNEIQESTPVLSTSLKQILRILFKPAFCKKLFLGGFLFSLTFLIYYKETLRILDVFDSELKFSVVRGTCLMINMAVVPIMLKYISRPMCICWCLLILALFYCAASIYSSYIKFQGIATCVCLIMAQNATIINHLLIMETFPTRVRTTASGICRAFGVVTVFVTFTVVNLTDVDQKIGVHGWTIYAGFMLVAAFLCVFISDTGNVPLPDTELQAIIHF